MQVDKRVAAVVTNFNGGERVLACIVALRRSRAPLQTIVVVDNASTDGSPARIREHFPDVELIVLARNEGPSPARSAGLRAVTTDLVLLVDDDVAVHETAVEHLIEAQAQSGAAVVTPRVVLHPGREIVQCDGAAAHFVGTMRLRHAYTPVVDLPVERSGVGACISACLLVDRARVLAAGGFDDLLFIYQEDLEFSLRMRSLGHDLVCEARAVAFHDRGLGTPGLSFRGRGAYPVRRAVCTHRHRWATMLIHYRWRTLVVLAPVLGLYEVASLAFFISHGWPQHWFGVWVWLLRQRRAIGVRRGRMQGSRVRSDRELLSGGRLPLAPNLIQSATVKHAIDVLSRAADGYWGRLRWLAG